LEHGGEAGFGVVEVEGADFGEAAEAVSEGVGVDVDGGGRGDDVAEGVQPGSEGLDQVGVVLAVVRDQAGDRSGRLVAARFDEVAQFEQQSLDMYVGQSGDTLRAAGCS
jgi:hypothetical protein